MDYEVEAIRSRDKPKKTWAEAVENDCQIQQLDQKDAMDCSKWYNTHKDRECASECFFWYQLTSVVLVFHLTVLRKIMLEYRTIFECLLNNV